MGLGGVLGGHRMSWWTMEGSECPKWALGCLWSGFGGRAAYRCGALGVLWLLDVLGSNM